MRVRWTAPAAADLERIVEYIRKDNPEAARSVEDTREILFPPWPYIAVYEIDDEVRVLRIRHAAQNWP